MSVHFPQQAGWLRGEALVLNSKFLSADKKEKVEDVFQAVAYHGKMSVEVFLSAPHSSFPLKKIVWIVWI